VKFENSVTENTTISLYDLLGRNVYTSTIAAGSNAANIDLSNLTKGNYIVKVSNEKTILYHQKIVKQ
jgi:hypothetical protein